MRVVELYLCSLSTSKGILLLRYKLFKEKRSKLYKQFGRSDDNELPEQPS